MKNKRIVLFTAALLLAVSLSVLSSCSTRHSDVGSDTTSAETSAQQTDTEKPYSTTPFYKVSVEFRKLTDSTDSNGEKQFRSILNGSVNVEYADSTPPTLLSAATLSLGKAGLDYKLADDNSVLISAAGIANEDTGDAPCRWSAAVNGADITESWSNVTLCAGDSIVFTYAPDNME